MVQGLVIAFGLMGILYYTISGQISEDISRTMIFTSLLCSNIFLTYTGRSERFTIFTTIKYRNRLLYVITLITIAILVLSLTVPQVMNVFNFSTLTFQQLLISILVSFISVIWIEFYKASHVHREVS